MSLIPDGKAGLARCVKRNGRGERGAAPKLGTRNPEWLYASLEEPELCRLTRAERVSVFCPWLVGWESRTMTEWVPNRLTLTMQEATKMEEAALDG